MLTPEKDAQYNAAAIRFCRVMELYPTGHHPEFQQARDEFRLASAMIIGDKKVAPAPPENRMGKPFTKGNQE